MPSLTERLKNSWNAFLGRDPTPRYDLGPGTYIRPDRPRVSMFANRSIVSTIYGRIAVDCAMVDMKHVKINKDDHYEKTIDSPLNRCLTHSANIDQTGRAFMLDIVISLFDEGCIALFPTQTSSNPDKGTYNIYEMRTAKIVEWYPYHVRIRAYNDRTGYQEEVMVPKESVAIIENPFYSIMNESNSLAQRLIRILAQLDRTNEQISSDKLDLIIQLPYIVKGPVKESQAESRRQSIVAQLTNSRYGIAYIDGTEKVTQLNRSLENNLWNQAKDLTQELYNQFGLTAKVFNGEADDKEMLNYYNRTTVPVLSAIQEEIERKFISQTARSQGQRIMYFRNPFKLVPAEQLAEIVDKFTRNEIMSSNDFRSILGMTPSNDPRADELINSNISQSKNDPRGVTGEGGEESINKIDTNQRIQNALSKL